MTYRRMLHPHVLFGALSMCACAEGEGEIEVRVWGEAFVEAGIPASAMDDGWTIEFQRFEVDLRDVSIAGTTFDDPGPLDITEPSEGRGQLVGQARVVADEYDDAAFTIANIVVEGAAEKGGVSKHFAWTFDVSVDYHDCEISTEVPRDGVGELQITVHADHLFLDSLVSQQPALRFDRIAAADIDGDGEVTMAELAATDIGPYDPGNLPIDDLWSFLGAQAQTMGHVDGEGHCAT